MIQIEVEDQEECGDTSDVWMLRIINKNLHEQQECKGEGEAIKDKSVKRK